MMEGETAIRTVGRALRLHRSGKRARQCNDPETDPDHAVPPRAPLGPPQPLGVQAACPCPAIMATSCRPDPTRLITPYLCKEPVQATPSTPLFGACIHIDSSSFSYA